MSASLHTAQCCPAVSPHIVHCFVLIFSVRVHAPRRSLHQLLHLACTPISGSVVHKLTSDNSSQPYSPLHISNQHLLRSYSKTGTAHRHFCSQCGSHHFVISSQRRTVVLQPGLWRFTGQSFEPEAHLNYENRQVKVPDGLKKYKDWPKELGGSGEECAE